MKSLRSFLNEKKLLLIVKFSPLILFLIQLLLMFAFPSNSRLMVTLLSIVSIALFLIASLYFKNLFDTVKKIKTYIEAQSESDETILEQTKNSFLFPIISSIKDLKNNYEKNIKNVSGDIMTVSMCTDSLDMISKEMAVNCRDFAEVEADLNNSVVENNTSIKNVSESTVELNENVLLIASAIEELSSSINEIVQNCNSELQIAKEASGISQTVNDKMRKLKEFTTEIAKVLSVIGDISDRTNLLALNATIEAASAGDAGKGFAVVANEVKDLARQTSNAASEIEEKIKEMEKSTDEAVSLVEKISSVNEEMNNISLNISATMEQQSTVINEIAKSATVTSENAGKISMSTDSISKVSDNITNSMVSMKETTESTHEQMEHVSGSVEMLKQIIDGLKTKVE